jgi:serine/threonine protein kinase/Tfp pilus assembly protein PilF
MAQISTKNYAICVACWPKPNGQVKLSGPEISTCPTCGTALEETSDGDLGCMVCLLHVGLSGENQVGEDSLTPADGRFGIYVIERRDDGSLHELGRGAMGITYLAIDTSLQRKIALKIINTDLAARSAEARERFMREARASAALRHENVATVYQFGVREETGQCFYVMELVEGETLEERVRRTGPLDVRITIAIGQQVAAALSAAEKRGLIHRDLKPANLMLIARDDEARTQDRHSDSIPLVKIIDFGLAKAVKRRDDPMSLTRGGFVGTPAFASPEQFDNPAVDIRSDIYSLGVTLWYALTGKTPFAGRSVDEIRNAQHSQVLPLEQLRAARVPSRIVSLLSSMLAMEPAARPSLAVLNRRLAACEGDTLRKYASLIGVGVVLVVAVLALFSRGSLPFPKATTTDISKLSIAVLPFENVSREADAVYFVNGIRAQISARLRRIGDFKVVADSSEESQPNIGQVAAALGVNHVLHGKIDKTGDRFRIALRLTNVQKGADVWSRSYERTFSEIPKAESEVAREVAKALGAHLRGPDRDINTNLQTTNPKAYEAYLKGRYVWLQRTSDAYRQAKQYFDEAISIDPQYAQAFVGLADVHQFLGAFDFDVQDRKENYDKARSAAQRALQLDPDLAEAHASMGLIAMNFDWDWPLAEQEFRRAIALDPNNALIRDWYAEYLMAVGRTWASIGQMERARDLDPLSHLINSDLGKMRYFARHYDEAERQLKQAIQIDPNFYQPREWLGLLYATLGRGDDAIALFSPLERYGPSVWVLGMSGYAYGMAGRKVEAQETFDALMKIKQRGLIFDKLPFVYACIGLGDKERALDYLEQDYQAHSIAIISLKSNPAFDSLRSEKRFVDLMRRMHLEP